MQLCDFATHGLRAESVYGGDLQSIITDHSSPRQPQRRRVPVPLPPPPFRVQDKVVIGMGQGAQLIASALGAGVVQNEQGPEIGWFPVKFTDVARHPRVFPFLPDELVVFHGHANTFQLPLGAKLLASSSACHNQAFLYENRVLAMQFHLEWTEEDVQNVLPQVGGACESTLARRAHAGRAGQSFPTLWCGPLSWGEGLPVFGVAT